MNTKLRVIATLCAASGLMAAAAGAETIAGWDFSQYRASGSLAPFTDTLPANYSHLDPTGNAGAESAAAGTLYFDGSFGSSSTLTDFLPTAGTMNCERRPIGGSLQPSGCSPPNVDGPVRSNRNEPWPNAGDTSFDAHSRLRAEGQAFQNLLAMRAEDNVSIVLEADAGTLSSAWGVSFGARTVSGGGDDGGPISCDPPGATECDATITVEFSPDGSSYTSFGSVPLTAEDTRYDVPLASGNATTGYVRLGLVPGSNGALPLIDNVAVTAFLPEPGSTALLIAGVLGLLAMPRRRS
jgi:hypothetical protein